MNNTFNTLGELLRLTAEMTEKTNYMHQNHESFFQNPIIAYWELEKMIKLSASIIEMTEALLKQEDFPACYKKQNESSLLLQKESFMSLREIQSKLIH